MVKGFDIIELDSLVRAFAFNSPEKGYHVTLRLIAYETDLREIESMED